MTNRQRAIVETVKFFLITVTISATIALDRLNEKN